MDGGFCQEALQDKAGPEATPHGHGLQQALGAAGACRRHKAFLPQRGRLLPQPKGVEGLHTIAAARRADPQWQVSGAVLPHRDHPRGQEQGEHHRAGRQRDRPGADQRRMAGGTRQRHRRTTAALLDAGNRPGLFPRHLQLARGAVISAAQLSATADAARARHRVLRRQEQHRLGADHRHADAGILLPRQRGHRQRGGLPRQLLSAQGPRPGEVAVRPGVGHGPRLQQHASEG